MSSRALLCASRRWGEGKTNVFKGGKLAALRRAGTAVLAGAVIGLAGATPALAADPVSATPRGGQTYGSVRLEGAHCPGEISPMWLDFGRDEKALAYCIDLHNPVAIDEEYAEGTWGASEVQNLGKVQWVLLHGSPKVGAEALLDAAGASKEGIRPRRLEAVAYAATQVAVWQFSDGAVLKRNDDFKPVEYRAIEKVVAHLTGNATDQPEPAAELKINPAGAAAVEQGGKAGPFPVTGPSGDITLTVTGGTAVDAAGNPVTKVVNAGQFFLTRA